MSSTLTPRRSGFDSPTDPSPPWAARLVDARKVYGSGDAAVVALDSVDLGFSAAGFTAIMGPSGSGKSTLLHCAAGLDHLSGGTAFIGDTDLTTLSDRDLTLLRRSRIGFVFQSFNLLPTLSASENILLPLLMSKAEPDVGVFDDIVDMVGLADRLDHRPAELSGGQQQRVAVARALVGQPTIVFADEPTGNLDSRAGQEILSFLRCAVDDRGQTLVMVTHDPGAAAWADRVVFMVDGNVHHELVHPDTDSVLATMRELGR